jgi:hypothetical protein
MPPATCSGKLSRRRRRKIRSSGWVASRRALSGCSDSLDFGSSSLSPEGGGSACNSECFLEGLPKAYEDRMILASKVQLLHFPDGDQKRTSKFRVRALKFGHMAIVAGRPKVLNYFFTFAGTRTRISSPPIGHKRRIVPAIGFGPFQNGSRKNSTPFRTASWDEVASTFAAYCPPGPEM